jgi:hypothetical protein
MSVDELDCGNHGCIFDLHSEGQHTTGGCSCLEDARYAGSRVRVRKKVVAFRDEILRLRADLAAAHAVLRDIQWASWEYSTGWNKCPECGGWKKYEYDNRVNTGHRPDCKLAAALGEAKA